MPAERTVWAPAAAQPAMAAMARGWPGRRLGSSAGGHAATCLPGGPGPGRRQLSGTQMTPSAAPPAGGNCSAGPVIAGVRGAICGQVMPLDVQ